MKSAARVETQRCRDTARPSSPAGFSIVPTGHTGDTQIIDTFAEAFRLRYARLVVTAHDEHWLEAALRCLRLRHERYRM